MADPITDPSAVEEARSAKAGEPISVAAAKVRKPRKGDFVCPVDGPVVPDHEGNPEVGDPPHCPVCGAAVGTDVEVVAPHDNYTTIVGDRPVERP